MSDDPAVPPAWEDTDRPILDAVARAEHAGALPDYLPHLGVEIPEDARLRALARLHRGGYVDAAVLRGGGAISHIAVKSLTERGLRETGAGPSEHAMLGPD